jgi:hypothetical protein
MLTLHRNGVQYRVRPSLHTEKKILLRRPTSVSIDHTRPDTTLDSLLYVWLWSHPRFESGPDQPCDGSAPSRVQSSGAVGLESSLGNALLLSQPEMLYILDQASSRMGAVMVIVVETESVQSVR